MSSNQSTNSNKIYIKPIDKSESPQDTISTLSVPFHSSATFNTSRDVVRWKDDEKEELRKIYHQSKYLCGNQEFDYLQMATRLNNIGRKNNWARQYTRYNVRWQVTNDSDYYRRPPKQNRQHEQYQHPGQYGQPDQYRKPYQYQYGPYQQPEQHQYPSQHQQHDQYQYDPYPRDRYGQRKLPDIGPVDLWKELRIDPLYPPVDRPYISYRYPDDRPVCHPE